MRLLDKPLTDNERENIRESLRGNFNRICISEDPEEIIAMLGFATDRLSMLAYSRIKDLKNRELDKFLDE